MTPTGNPPLALPEGYADWLAQLKGQIAQARQRAALSVNAELVQLYSHIGRDILQRQKTQGWGAKVIDRLAHDLKDAFPDMRGFSTCNCRGSKPRAESRACQICPMLRPGHVL